MSLFGDAADEPSPQKSKSALFDESSKTQKNGAGGLFADESNDAHDSPWNFTPKKTVRSNPAKSLLANASVPESYLDVFDALVEAGYTHGSGISATGIQHLLEGSGVHKEEREHILKIATQGSSIESFSRNEFNVIVALIGLAQEEEEVTLDGVDERRSRLPQPTLPHHLRSKLAGSGANESSKENRISPKVTSSHAPEQTNRASYSESDDPWASSPQQVRASDVYGKTNDARNVNDKSKTTSSFITHAETSSVSSHQRSSSNQVASTGDEWGFASTASVGMPDSTFAGDSARGEDEGFHSQPTRQPRLPRAVSQGLEEVMTVTILPEKEGSFMFQYRNYEITSSRKATKVVRRYSDFVWLLDCLHKRYPFRQLPLLPPKRVAINGRHIAADVTFIEKRRRGLTRFVNSLIRHPVLKDEQLVTMFLTVPTELAALRKQAAITVQEEFVGKALPLSLEDSLPQNLEDLFQTVRNGVQRSSESYINLCAHLERIIKRQSLLAVDYSRFAGNLKAATEFSQDTYHIDANDVPMLNEGIDTTSRHIESYNNLLHDQSRALDEITLEDYKQQRDALVSMRDMFDRRDRFARDNIPQLEKRIAGNESKLVAVRAKPEGTRKPGEAEKLEEAIMKDKESIVSQHARGVFIKECVRDEIRYWQASQYHVNRTQQEFSQEMVKYAELQADNFRTWTESVESLPTRES